MVGNPEEQPLSTEKECEKDPDIVALEDTVGAPISGTPSTTISAMGPCESSCREKSHAHLVLRQMLGFHPGEACMPVAETRVPSWRDSKTNMKPDNVSS